MSHSATSETPATPPPRRSFLTIAATVITSGLLGIIPLALATVFALDPLARKKKAAEGDGFLKVATLTELPADGTPVRFTVQADRVDAWNLYRQQTIGTVYLRKIAEQVIAFNDTCPHLGCKVDYKPSGKDGPHYYCPCHASAFRVDSGEKQNAIPPRGMDTLEVRVKEDGTVWVKYQEFRAGITEKIVVA